MAACACVDTVGAGADGGQVGGLPHGQARGAVAFVVEAVVHYAQGVLGMTEGMDPGSGLG